MADRSPPDLAGRGPPPHERILAAARELFCRDGIHATGIDRVLARAGASKMTLYGRFGSKEALVREVLTREGSDWRAAFFAALDATPEPAGRLRAVVPALRAWFEGGKFYGCAFMNAAAEHAKGAAGGEPWLRTLTATHHGEILDYLTAQAVAAGAPEPGVLARQVLLVIDGSVAAMMVTGSAGVLDVAARTLDDVLARVPAPA